ncbi:ABC transporter permease [Acidocella sp.]|uniref:ABC transporter permease n=1 Tax=Acidocella sp. TaxID=50710 RepID=UPI003CFD070E
MNPVNLSFASLAVTSSLVLLCAGLSLALSLQVHRTLLIAALRMVAQLLLVGFVLRLIFDSSSLALTLLAAGAMAAAASWEVGARQEHRLPGRWQLLTAGSAIVPASFIVCVLALTTALRPVPWYDAREALPLAGILLGNVMNAVSLALNGFLGAVSRERASIEARLALGEGRYAALQGASRRAIRTALIPTINVMNAAGIITLPGIMTGQLLAGMDPISAAKYQILLMFLIVGGNCLGAFVAVYAAIFRLTDQRERLRADRLRSRLM